MAQVQDPYTPPTSDVDTTPDLLPPRRGWTAYFWLIAVLTALSVVGILTLVELQTLDFVDVPVTCLGALGLWGYARRRAILSVVFWRRWLPIEIGWDLLVQFVLAPAGVIYVYADQEPTAPGDDLWGLAFVLPLYFALYRYAYRSPELWPTSRPTTKP